MAALRILIIEDEPDIRKVVGMTLTKRLTGLDMVEATDGEEGIKAFETLNPALIITDIRMPRIGGVEMIAYIRKADPDIPIIVLTGFPDTQIAVSLMRDAHVSDFLVKPVNGDVLARSVERCLNSRKQHPLRQLFARLLPRAEAPSATVNTPTAQTDQVGESAETLSSEDKTALAAIIHDLKNEFTRLAKASRSLVLSKSYCEEEFQIIGLGVEYSQLLLRKLLDYLQMGPLPVQPTSIVEVVAKAEDLIRPRLPPNVKFSCAFDSVQVRSNLKANSNGDQLLSILVQLVNNAQGAFGPGQGEITLAVQVKDKSLLLKVSDNGPGIPQEFRDVIFRRPLPRKGGVGLGLFLAHRIIVGWNGQIFIERSDSQGTTITISLPIAISEP